MGKMIESPRYNVISFRLSDDEMQRFQDVCGNRTRQQTMLLIMQGVFNKQQEAQDGQ
jgi:hypothetical protein